MKKRLFAVFVSLCLIVSMLPVTVFAGEEQTAGIGTETVAECICTDLCSGDKVNKDCPVCSAEGAELDKVCVGVAPMLPVTALAAGEHDSHSDGWTELTAGTTTLSGGSYYLSGDVEYTGTESITVSGEVILCLNGQELDLKGQHISVGSGASLTLCDCSTGGVLTGGSGAKGGGVYVDGGGTFILTGGNIAGNTANAGGGVYVNKGGTFTMEGGSISNNKATVGGGGGVMVYEGSFTLSGGSITGNATNTNTNGFGGGVCLYGTFYLSGDSIIQNNTKAGTTDNLYLGWQTINITGPLGKNAHIGVTAENVPRTFISGWSNNMVGENPADYFSSDGDAGGIGLNADGDVVLGSLCTTITLNPNGGTLPEYSLVEGAALPIPTKTGYTFAGWYENPEFSGNPVTDIPTNNTEELTFYAKWTVNTYTVTFDANGGSVSQTSAVTVAGKLTSLPTPTYDGYDFLGWYTDKDGGDKVTTDTVFTMDSTIYAHWQNIPVTGLKLNKDNLTLQEKGSDTLTATVEPADATNQDVTWKSSDTSIATVSADGTVTAISAGTATITATAKDGSGVSASCAVTVKHGNMVHTPKKDATCTADGNKEYWTCSTCKKYFSDAEGENEISLAQTVIDARGHSYKDGKCTVCGAIASDFKVVITEGANGSWQKGTKDGLSFTSNAAYEHFQKVQVDGKDLDASNYTVKEGSTIVTLKASYLETLSVGKHTLSIVSDTGTATTEFTIDGWKTEADGNRYYYRDGERVKGEFIKAETAGDYYFTDPDTGAMVRSDWVSVQEADPYNNNIEGTVWYHMGTDGLMQRGWIKDETGWKIYYLDSNGRMCHSTWINAAAQPKLGMPAGLYNLCADGAVQMNGWAKSIQEGIWWFCEPDTGWFNQYNPSSWSSVNLEV